MYKKFLLVFGQAGKTFNLIHAPVARCLLL